MEMLNSLREATAELHRKLEGDNLAGKIIDHSISLEEYRLLLIQNFIAYRSVERQLNQFLSFENMEKTLQLEEDLLTLGVDDLDHIPDIDFNCKNEAEAIGAAYVVEGSAMGGMLIGKEIPNCETLNSLPPQKFFSGGRDSVKSWNNFLKFLRSRDFSEEEKEIASTKAQETFRLFGKAFKVELSEY
jgi:heme oxygenase